MEIDLTDRDAVNEAVAKAIPHPHEVWCDRCGWVDTKPARALRDRCKVCLTRVQNMAPWLGDDPVLNDEMEKALHAVAGRVAVVWRAKRGWCVFVTCHGQTTAGDWMPTKAEALVLALDAAGLLKEDDE